jgi:hypothetical protein
MNPGLITKVQRLFKPSGNVIFRNLYFDERNCRHIAALATKQVLLEYLRSRPNFSTKTLDLANQVLSFARTQTT